MSGGEQHVNSCPVPSASELSSAAAVQLLTRDLLQFRWFFLPLSPISLEWDSHLIITVVRICRELCGSLLIREDSWIKLPPWLDPIHS